MSDNPTLAPIPLEHHCAHSDDIPTHRPSTELAKRAHVLASAFQHGKPALILMAPGRAKFSAHLPSHLTSPPHTPASIP